MMPDSAHLWVIGFNDLSDADRLWNAITGLATLQLTRSDRRSDHCANWREVEYEHNVCAYSHATRGNID